MEPNIAPQIPIQPAPEPAQQPIQPSQPVSEPIQQTPSQPNQIFVPKKSLPKWPLVIVGVILIATLLTGAYLLEQKSNNNVACTTEAKICPDGSSVGRTGPKCEFSACPKTLTPTPIINGTTNWKTYTSLNEEYQFKYPNDWTYVEKTGYTQFFPPGTNLLKLTSLDGIYYIDLTISQANPEDCNGDCPVIEKASDIQIDMHKTRKLEGYIGAIGGNTPEKYQKIVINLNSKYYNVTLHSGNMDNIASNKIQTFNQMLSTFKFTDQITNNIDTKNWTSYISEKGKFTIKYPSTWQQPVNKEGCGPGFFDRSLYLGPDDKSVLICQSSYGGQISVQSTNGDKKAIYEFKTGGYAGIKHQEISISGISGEKIDATASGQWGEGALENGTKVVRYLFYTNGVTYVASYFGKPHDVLADFELMVSTLKFTQ